MDDEIKVREALQLKVANPEQDGTHRNNKVAKPEVLMYILIVKYLKNVYALDDYHYLQKWQFYLGLNRIDFSTSTINMDMQDQLTSIYVYIYKAIILLYHK